LPSEKGYEAIYRHSEQRPLHLIRHGPAHTVRHLRRERHGHRRTVVDPENRIRNAVIYSYIGIGLVVAALVTLAAISYVSIHRAQDDLSAAKGVISSDLGNQSLLTTPNGRATLAADLGAISKDAAEASASVTGSTSLRLLGYLPYIGTQREGVIALANDVEQATVAGNAMLTSLDNLVANSHGTTVSLPALATLEQSVLQGHATLASLIRPTNGLLGSIAHARTAFDKEDAKLERLLALSARTIAFARPFLGSGGPQTYLIAGENNAEMRDGGSIESLDVLTTSNGQFSIQHDATYGDYLLSSPANVALPAGTQKVFGAFHPTEEWPSTDATADFALSGESMQAMWAQATGQHVDGVIGIDVPGVASILKLTGPVTVSGITTPISATNVADILLNKAYQGLPVNDPSYARRGEIAAVVKAAVDQMKGEQVDLDRFASALSSDVNGRHLTVWSDIPSTESGLVTLDAAGTLTSSDPGRTFHVAVENATADKLDYFVAVAVHVRVTVDSSGNALVATTIQAVNFAKPGQPPSYQYGPDGVNSVTPGEYGARIFLWGPTGSVMPGATDESGLKVVQSHFALLPDQHNQVEFSSFIPHAVQDGRLDLRLVPQARLTPDRLTISLRAPGWSMTGATHMKKLWANTLSLHWELSR
jgi:Protein of unknown function (DUF4012)